MGAASTVPASTPSSPLAGWKAAPGRVRARSSAGRAGDITSIPVKGLKVAGTVNYDNVDAKRLAQDIVPGTGAYAVDRKADGVQTLIRVQRDF